MVSVMFLELPDRKERLGGTGIPRYVRCGGASGVWSCKDHPAQAWENFLVVGRIFPSMPSGGAY